MMTLFKKVTNAISDFVFPPLCLHCKEHLKGSQLICKGCAFAFELIDLGHRCKACFSETENGFCFDCLRKKKPFRVAAACDYREGVVSLVSHLKNGKTPNLAKTAAAFMAMQLSRLDWPIFDIIVPIPKRLWFQENNHAHLIAKALGNMLSVEVKNCLKRVSGGLPRSKIWTHEEMHFYLKDENSLKEKNVLLVDDLIITGRTLRNSATLLQTVCKEVCCLAFAKL